MNRKSKGEERRMIRKRGERGRKGCDGGEKGGLR
jgi:hypothetical protein